MTKDNPSKTKRGVRFMCDNCGYANVHLIDDGAYCTACDTKYLPRELTHE